MIFSPVTLPDESHLWRRAGMLAALTIWYNLAEGLVSVWLGVADETVTLFGFGLDSFAEVISGIGVWHLFQRLRASGETERDPFERSALRVTGGAFYLLAASLAVSAIANLVTGHRPETTFWGGIVAVVSIASMWLLIRAKVRVGTALASPAILADAACTRTCLRLSVVLLVASVGYELTGIAGIDSLGTLAIAWFALREGQEAFGRARGRECCCCSTGH